jgi:TolB-like protein
VKIPVLFAFLLVISAGMMFAGGGSEGSAESSSGNTIDQAVSYQSDYILRRSPDNASIAIVQITSSNETLSKYIIDELPNYIVGNKKEIVVVERQRLDIIENEIAFQLSGDVSDTEVVSIGEKIGAKLVVTGAISQIGDSLRLNIKIIDVKTARLIGSNSCDIKIDRKVRALLSDNGKLDVPVASAEKQEKPKPKQNNTDFSNGAYIGYIFSPITPYGVSLGRLDEGKWSIYYDTEFSFPSFDGYSSSSETYDRLGNVTEFANEVYIYENKSTNFTWEEIFGINGALYAPFLWFSVGVGFDYTIVYRLLQKYYYTTYGNNSLSRSGDPEWYKPDTDAQNFDMLVQAGLHLKISHLLLSLKYKHIFNRGSSYDLGIGYIFNIRA